MAKKKFKKFKKKFTKKKFDKKIKDKRQFPAWCYERDWKTIQNILPDRDRQPNNVWIQTLDKIRRIPLESMVYFGIPSVEDDILYNVLFEVLKPADVIASIQDNFGRSSQILSMNGLICSVVEDKYLEHTLTIVLRYADLPNLISHLRSKSLPLLNQRKEDARPNTKARALTNPKDNPWRK